MNTRYELRVSSKCNLVGGVSATATNILVRVNLYRGTLKVISRPRESWYRCYKYQVARPWWTNVFRNNRGAREARFSGAKGLMISGLPAARHCATCRIRFAAEACC